MQKVNFVLFNSLEVQLFTGELRIPFLSVPVLLKEKSFSCFLVFKQSDWQIKFAREWISGYKPSFFHIGNSYLALFHVL